MNKLLFLLWLPCFIVAAAPPLQLSITDDGTQRQFRYRFDYHGATEQLNFALDRQQLAGHFRQFKGYKTAFIQQYLWRDIQREAAAYPNVRLTRLPGPQQLQYRLSGTDIAAVNTLDSTLTKLLAERQAFYLQQAYYTELALTGGQPAIIPDHVRIAQDSLQDLNSVALAIKARLTDASARDTVNYLANWIQQIPYQDLSDRQQSSGNSFSPPLKLLLENRADCDSKAVLMAALLRQLLPEIKLAFIYPPNHALLALSMPLAAGDNSVLLQGAPYLLVDPTGPALMPAGEISDDYKIYTGNSAVSYRLF